MRTCDHCPAPHLARGLCRTHYERWRTTGTADLHVTTDLDRYWAKVLPTDGCWLWTGTHDASGYGRFWLDGRSIPAHHVVRTPLHGLQVDHLCRTRNCVRWDHLDVVTAQVNTLRQPRHVERTACHAGHPYEGNRDPVSRRCKACRRKS
jgi:hypothetical protein